MLFQRCCVCELQLYFACVCGRLSYFSVPRPNKKPIRSISCGNGQLVAGIHSLWKWTRVTVCQGPNALMLHCRRWPIKWKMWFFLANNKFGNERQPLALFLFSFLLIAIDEPEKVLYTWKVESSQTRWDEDEIDLSWWKSKWVTATLSLAPPWVAKKKSKEEGKLVKIDWRLPKEIRSLRSYHGGAIVERNLPPSLIGDVFLVIVLRAFLFR